MESILNAKRMREDNGVTSNSRMMTFSEGSRLPPVQSPQVLMEEEEEEEEATERDPIV